MVFPSPMLFAERGRIVDLARKLRVPLISMSKQFVKLGGLLSYGADTIDLPRRAASFVDRILKGASPADLPVEQPTKYELKRFPPDLNRRDSQRVKDERIFVH
jgi:putative ABC transport system substrate-binding protein